MIPFIGPVIEMVGGFVRRQQDRAEAKHHAKLEEIRTGAHERSNGWKDELALVVILLPFVAAFIPGAGEYIRHGFDTLKNSTPEWYQDLFFWGVAAALGIQSVIKPFKR